MVHRASRSAFRNALCCAHAPVSQRATSHGRPLHDAGSPGAVDLFCPVHGRMRQLRIDLGSVRGLGRHLGEPARGRHTIIGANRLRSIHDRRRAGATGSQGLGVAQLQSKRLAGEASASLSARRARLLERVEPAVRRVQERLLAPLAPNDRATMVAVHATSGPAQRDSVGAAARRRVEPHIRRALTRTVPGDSDDAGRVRRRAPSAYTQHVIRGGSDL